LTKKDDVTFNVDTSEVDRKVRELAEKLDAETVEKISYEGAEMVTAEVRRRAPRGPTGRLKESAVTRQLDGKFGSPGPAIAAMDFAVAPHAWLAEYYNPSRHGTQPYFRPAIDAMRSELKRHMERSFKRLVK